MPRPSVRLRLTLLYSVLFLVSGAVLLAITYVLFRRATGINFIVPSAEPTDLSPHARQLVEAKAATIESSHADDLNKLLTQSGIALAIMTVASLALGWLVAGRVLRPLREMTATTRQISERNLHERLALAGPRDELKDLADTVDGLLARLETAFGAQQRFVANAAHELRTPLTLWRALLEERLTDPDATIDDFRATSRRLLALGEEQERLLESLLTLASSERGLDRREPFDLAVTTREVLAARRNEARRRGIGVDAVVGAAPTSGDPRLGERLVANLVDNALRHNLPGGRIEVSTRTSADGAVVRVANSGPVIPQAEVARLLQPFQRLAPGRNGRDDGAGVGLGLSIVHAIADAHGAALEARARPEGGLEVEVRFPAATPAPVPAGRAAVGIYDQTGLQT
jgi:signal transduction histidine kinase